MMLAAGFGVGQVVWSLLWFALLLIWMYMFVFIVVDILRSADLTGWGKALWTVLVIFLPYLGIFVYLIVRGATMFERGPILRPRLSLA